MSPLRLPLPSAALRWCCAWALLAALAPGCARGAPPGGASGDGGGSAWDGGGGRAEGGRESGAACTAADCDDGDACTTDACDPASGCTHQPLDCDDGDACTTDACDPASGCTHQPLDCDDGDACTTDACDPASGCTHERMAPAAERCDGAVAITASGSVRGTTRCAAHSAAAGCGGGPGPEVYYRLEVPTTSRVVLSTSGSETDVLLALGSGCPPAGGACDDDSGGGTEARLEATLEPGTYHVMVESKEPGGGDFQLDVDITPLSEETVAFPSAGDTVVPSHGYLWQLGSSVTGTRTVSLPSFRSVRMHLVVGANVLSCDTQDMRLLVGGVELGRFSIARGTTTVDRTFTPPSPLPGGAVTLRYETVRTVASGCGSAQLSTAGSTVTFVP